MICARSFVFVVALILCLSFTALANNPSGSCSATSPCTQGCCSNTGYCGFGPTYCGQGNCTSNCNAQAQCGQYAPAGQTTCPLNVCCSQYGFCGTTSDFCGTGCQNGCAVPTAPSCASSGGSSNLRTIGYYESWSYQRSCDTWTPESIDATQWTHLNYAFALIGSDFRISQMNSFDTQLYPRFTGLKSKNPALKVFISVGGWAAGGQIFSQMTSSESNRQAFISSAIAFMTTYAFDGIDIDWEYPVAPDRQGAPADFQNYVTFLRELRAACGSRFGISITIPTSYWYMQHFDIVNLEPSIDWFNLMAYDLHGTWDGTNPYTQAVVQAHTNLTEIDQAAQLLWRNNIDPNKVVLGLGFYGRSFTLKSSSCTTPGCAFSGGGNPGNCTQTSGILSDAEIQGIITQYSVTPILDPVAAVKYMTWSGNQWVSYDDTQTFNLKRAYANSHCLSGTMVWAVDLDSDTGSGVNSLNSGNQSFASAQLKAATSSYNGATLGVFWTPCLPPGSQVCPSGYDEVALGHGKVFDADLNHVSGEGCHGGGNGFNRVLCAPRGLYMANCAWGSHNAGLCNSKCPKGYITVTKNSHKGGARIGCDVGRYTPFCCQSVTGYSGGQCYSSPLNHALAGSLAARDDPSGISQYSYSNTANYKIRRDDELAGKRNLTEGQSDEHTDKAVSKLVKRQGTGGAGCLGNGPLPIGAIPVDIPAYIYQDYAGLGFGGGFDVSLSPVATASPTTSSRNRKTVYVTIPTDVTIYSTATRTCNGAKYPQACLNYRSISSAYSYFGYGTPTCAPTGVKNPARPLVDLYNAQRNTAWINTWITKTYINPNGKRAKPNCQRDEWPPAHFQQGAPQGYIRLLPGAQNGGVANDKVSGWKGFCKYPPEQRTSLEGGPVSYYYDIVYTTIYSSRITTLSVMDYEFTSMPTYAGDVDGLTTNACYPSTLIQDPGFALFNNDHYYLLTRSGRNYQTYDYRYPPGSSYTSGKSPPSKRGLSPPGFEYHDEEEVITFDDGNSTRVATDEELLEHFDLARCNSPDCAEELAELEALENVLLGKPVSAAAPTEGVLAETSTLEHVAMVTAAASAGQSWQSATVVTQTRADVRASQPRSPVTHAPEPTAVILDLQQDADGSSVDDLPLHIEHVKDELRRVRQRHP